MGGGAAVAPGQCRWRAGRGRPRRTSLDRWRNCRDDTHPPRLARPDDGRGRHPDLRPARAAGAGQDEHQGHSVERRTSARHRSRQLGHLRGGGAQRRPQRAARGLQGARRRRRDRVRHGSRLRRVGRSRGPDRQRTGTRRQDLLGDQAERRRAWRQQCRSGGGAQAGGDLVRPHQEGEDRPHPGAQHGRCRRADPDPAGLQEAGPRPLHRPDDDLRGPVPTIS